MAKQTVALYTVTSGDRVERARSSLAEALGGATLGDPDDAGVFEVSVDAKSAASDAASTVRDAATGAADSVRDAVDEKGFAGAASDYASTAAGAAQTDR